MDFRFGTIARSVLIPHMDKNANLPDPPEFFPWNKPIVIVLSPEELCRQSELGAM